MEYKFIKKFQDGGAMAPEAAPQGAEQGGAPAEQGAEQDPMAMLLQAAAQALQNQDCNMAMQVCQALVQLAQQGQGGGAPEEAGQPVYKKGGKLVRRIK